MDKRIETLLRTLERNGLYTRRAPNAESVRVRNCCAPMHAKTKQRGTPCVVTGKRANCNSPERLCRITGIIERKPSKTDITIILVDQDLGLGWEDNWDQTRVKEISDRYVQSTGVCRPSWIQR